MLRSRGLAASYWSAADVVSRQLVQAGIIIALARLLTPEDFGTVALLSLFLAIATVLADGGFSTALIQRQDATHADESSAVWVNLGVGALLSMIIFLVAPVLAGFYDSTVLEPLARLMSLGVLLSALGTVPHALVMKRLGFRTLLVVGLAGTASSGAVAVLLAWHDYGVWALAGQYVTLAAVNTAMLWILSGWRPALVFRADSARTLFGFGGYMLASGLLDASFSRLYTVLIGRWYGVRELGFYVRAETTQQVPASVLSSIAARVALPVFSEAAGDPARLRRGARLALRGLMLINTPTMLGLAALAGPLVEAVFGSAWLPAVPLLQVLCLAGMLWPLHVVNLTLLTAQGHGRLVFRIEVVKQVLGLGLVLIGALGGPLGIAWAMVAGGLVAVVVNAFYTQRFVGYGLVAQLVDVGPTVAVSAAMAAVVAVAARTWDPPPVVELFALTGLGAVMFVGLALAVRLATLHDMVALLRSRPVK